VRFDPCHAEDIALPSAYILVAELFPHVSGTARDKLIRRVTELLMATLLAFCEFHPQGAIPTPSQN